MAGQRPLLERAAGGDREAFARLYDDQVEGVYRYLLAWTGDQAEAADLTGQVFRDAFGWLPATAGGEVEAGAWLIAMARDAVAQRRGSGWIAGPEGPRAPASGAVAAVARLGDPEREVVVLCLLVGHSPGPHRAPLGVQPAGRAAPSAEEFERRLGSWEIDLTGSDPALANALAAAGSLRRAIPGYVVAPDGELVQRLRGELVGGEAPATLPHRGPSSRGARTPRPRRPRPGRPGGTGLPRPWPPPGSWWCSPSRPSTGRRRRRGAATRPCPVPTTAAVVAAGGGSLPPPPTTVVRSSTTSSTPRNLAPAPAAAPTSAATAPPTSRPPASAAQTIGPRPPTTTRAPTTTAAPPTTLSVTTTTAAPAPT
jgi:hypothetical protein